MRIIIQITDRYEGGPVRLHDQSMRIIERPGSLAAWIETDHPERWGIAPDGGILPAAGIVGIRVFPADSLDAAKRQLTDWAWLDQARLDS